MAVPSLRQLCDVAASLDYPVSIDPDGLEFVHDLLVWLIGKTKQKEYPVAYLLDMLGPAQSVYYYGRFVNEGVRNLQEAMQLIANDFIDDILAEADAHGLSKVGESEIVEGLCDTVAWQVFYPYIAHRCGTLS